MLSTKLDVSTGTASRGSRAHATTEMGIRSSDVRPATAVVILILLGIIAIAGIIQLWLIYSPPG